MTVAEPEAVQLKVLIIFIHSFKKKHTTCKPGAILIQLTLNYTQHVSKFNKPLEAWSYLLKPNWSAVLRVEGYHGVWCVGIGWRELEREVL